VLDTSVIVFAVTKESEATDQETSYTKFAYPYFYQTALENHIQNTFLASKKFKDNFNTTFVKLFMPTQNQSQGQTQTQTENQTETGSQSESQTDSANPQQ